MIKPVFEWLEANCNKIILPHIGPLTNVQRIGQINDNRKKDDLVNFDQGFNQIPFDHLSFFASEVQRRLGQLPTPIDHNWEEVVWLFSMQFIDDPDNSHE